MAGMSACVSGYRSSWNFIKINRLSRKLNIIKANLEELGLSRHFEWDDLRESIVVQPETGVMMRPIFQYTINYKES